MPSIFKLLLLNRAKPNATQNAIAELKRINAALHSLEKKGA